MALMALTDAAVPDTAPPASTELSPSARARVLAVFYLLVVGCGIVAQVLIADRMVVRDNAEQTVANILANPRLYRLAFTLFLIEMAAQVVSTMMFYDLLKPVNPRIARLSAIMGLVGAGIKTLARAFYYLPLVLLGGASYLSAFDMNQLSALSMIFLKVNNQAAAIALVFFGFGTVLQGWLIYRSRFLPRVFGVLSMIGGVGWLTYLWPPLGSQAFLFVALFAMTDVICLTAWLFIRGVHDDRWRAQARLAAISSWR
jgi:hypothetical protein